MSVSAYVGTGDRVELLSAVHVVEQGLWSSIVVDNVVSGILLIT